MHILIMCFIADPFDPPGYERCGGGHLFLYDLGRFLVRKGLTVSYLTRLNSDLKSEYDQIGPLCTIFRIRAGPALEIPLEDVATYIPQLYNKSKKIIEELEHTIDIIHTHYWIAGKVAIKLRRFYSVKHIHSILSLGRLKWKLGKKLDKYEKLRDACELSIFNNADFLVSVCPSEKENILKYYSKVDHNKVVTIPYGVDPNVFFPRPESPSDFVRRSAIGFKEGINYIP